MAPLSFTDGSSGCSLPPFAAVSNRLFFFRINVFEIDLPQQALPQDAGEGRAALGGQFGKARLGLPIADLFPDLLPEYAPSLPAIGPGQSKMRLHQGVFLPVPTLNRRHSAAHLVPAAAIDLEGKRVTIGGRSIDLPDDQWHALRAGQSATLVVGDALARILPPPESIAQTAPRAGFFSSGAAQMVPGAPFPNLRSLSDSQFETLCFAVFLDSDAPGYEWLDRLSPKDRARLKANCSSDARFPSFDRKRKGKNRLSPPRYEIGFVSEYEQAWDLTGYSRGALVSSLTLAPEEELVIEVFTWDRAKLEEEQGQTTETERSVETSSMARVSAQLNSDLSETTDKNASLGLGAPLPIGPVTVDASGQASVSNSIAQSIRSTVDTISETTRRASERFKTTTQVKVVQTRETGTETRVTRRIRNPNRGRTLTMHCFEVMEHYQVSTRLLRADKFVLLVEVPQPKSFDIHLILAQEEKLQRALLGPGFLPGFAAAKKLLAQRFFDRRSLIKAEIEAAQGKARGDAAPAEPPIVALARDLRKKLNRMVKLDLVEEVGVLANAYLPGNSISQKDRAEAEDALGVFNFWIKFKTVTPGVESRARNLLEAVPSRGALSAQEAHDALASLTTGLDDEWLTSVKMVAASLVSAQLAFTLLVPFPWLAPVLLELAVVENNLGLPSLLEKAKQAVRSYEATLQQPAAPTDQGADKGQRMMPPPQLFSLQELALADAEFKKLVLHLEANRVYYMNSVFAQQDANVRYETLKALGVHGFVENRLLGFLGSRAVLPLRVECLEPEVRTFLEQRVTAGLGGQMAAVGPASTDISLPTNGLHMEPVLGQCDALEPFLKESRAIELALRRAQADQAIAAVEVQRAEGARLQARLAASPPLLEDPFVSPGADGRSGG